MTRRRLIRSAIIMLLCSIVFAYSRGASGAAEDFSSFEMAAKATAAQWTFDSPSLGIPANPTGELNIAFTQTSLQSGPTGYGNGSILWPGQVAANVPGFIVGEIESGCQCDIPIDQPNYPVRAESFYPQGPGQASLDVGTAHMRSTAKESYSEGVAYLNRFGFPGVGTIGNQSSMSSSGFDPQGAVSMAEATATDVSFLGRAIKLDSVVTTATARSDGTKATLAGETVITGAEVAGTPVTIDENGVHIADQEGIAAAAAQQAVNGVLAELGVTIESSAPVDTVTGPKGSRALGGVILSVKSSTIEPLIAGLPADLQQQIRRQITFDQEMTVQMAPAVVMAGAVKILEFPAVAPPTDVGGGAATTGSGGSAAGLGETSVGDTGASGSTGRGADAAVGDNGGGIPIRTAAGSTGVPVWLVVALMIAAFVSSRPLTALADRALAARAAGGSCPLETS